jgi:hypothetical protein
LPGGIRTHEKTAPFHGAPEIRATPGSVELPINSALAMAEEAVAITVRYTTERLVSGKPLFDLQNTRFKLAEGIGRYIAGQLDDVSTAVAKYWLTERPMPHHR